MKQHQQVVTQLSAQLQQSQSQVAMKESLGNATRTLDYKKGCQKLDFSPLNRVIGIENHLAIVEPRVTMEELVRETLSKGFIPQVVPEFRSITVGGAISGVGLESTSHLYGQFNDTCEWIEVLLGDGTSLRLSREEHADLFWALPGSYGSLAYVTLAAIRLVPAKRSVQVRFSRGDTFVKTAAHFLDGLVGDEIASISGDFSDKPARKKKAWDRWFYQERGDELLLSTEDYLFRYDRGAFWMGRYLLHPKLFAAYLFKKKIDPMKALASIGQRNPGKLFRLLFGWMVSTKQLYRGLHAMPQEMRERAFVIQDCVIPLSRLKEFIDLTGNIRPLWLCPIKSANERQLFSIHQSSEELINVGVYGASQGDSLKVTHELEQALIEWEGRKALYTNSTYTPEEFWKIYDRDHYLALRKKYHAERFVDIDEKVV